MLLDMGFRGSFEHQTEEDAAGMIHLNCEALTRITYLVLPYLRRGSLFIRWHLCGICSAAEFHSLCSNQSICEKFLYCIAAGAVLSRDQGDRSMSRTSKNGVFDRAYEQEEMKFYKKFVMADPKKVVRKAIRDARKNKAVSVYGMTMKVTRVICKLLPGRWIAKIMGK